MAKLILSVDGVALKEISLERERTTIGRKSQNDIQIDNLAVSGEHAVIISLLNDAFLEDLNSTNGTYVNGRSIKKHFLQNGDVIELAKYRLKFVSNIADQNGSGDVAKTVVLRPEALRGALEGAVPNHAAAGNTPEAEPELPSGTLHVLTGANAGREIVLNKTVTTLGKPGVMVTAIARRPRGYYITHVEGARRPRVGGRALEDNRPYALMDHDIIELGGIKMAFYLRG